MSHSAGRLLWEAGGSGTNRLGAVCMGTIPAGTRSLCTGGLKKRPWPSNPSRNPPSPVVLEALPEVPVMRDSRSRLVNLIALQNGLGKAKLLKFKLEGLRDCNHPVFEVPAPDRVVRPANCNCGW